MQGQTILHFVSAGLGSIVGAFLVIGYSWLFWSDLGDNNEVFATLGVVLALGALYAVIRDRRLFAPIFSGMVVSTAFFIIVMTWVSLTWSW